MRVQQWGSSSHSRDHDAAIMVEAAAVPMYQGWRRRAPDTLALMMRQVQSVEAVASSCESGCQATAKMLLVCFPLAMLLPLRKQTF